MTRVTSLACIVVLVSALVFVLSLPPNANLNSISFALLPSTTAPAVLNRNDETSAIGRTLPDVEAKVPTESGAVSPAAAQVLMDERSFVEPMHFETSRALCFCAERLAERRDAPRHKNASDDRSGLYRCSPEELAGPSLPTLVYCTFTNVCVRREPEDFNPDDDRSPSMVVIEMFVNETAGVAVVPSGMYRARVEKLTAADSPLDAFRRAASGPHTRYYHLGEGSESVATVGLHRHPFNSFHSLHESMRLVFANFEFANVPEHLRRHVLAVDAFRKINERVTVDMPAAFNVTRWNDAQMPGVKRICFERPVIVGFVPHTVAEDYADLASRYRTHVVDAHLGAGAAARSQEECSRWSQGRILYLKRPYGLRSVFNGQDVDRYLASLSALGFKVTSVEITSAMPMTQQVQLATGHDLILGPHGSKLVHGLWLPSPCGLVVELLPDVDFMLRDSHFFERVTRWHDKRLMYWSVHSLVRAARGMSNFPQEGIVVDVADFHRALMRFLAAHRRWAVTEPYRRAVKLDATADGSLVPS